MDTALLENPAPKLIAHFGTRAAVAAHFGISVEAVRLWLKKGIPEDRALDAEEATRGSGHAIAAMEVLLYAKQQRDGSSGAAVQFELPGGA